MKLERKGVIRRGGIFEVRVTSRSRLLEGEREKERAVKLDRRKRRERFDKPVDQGRMKRGGERGS